MLQNQPSIVFDTDSYKVSMWKQYPPGTETVYSYASSRGGRYPKALFFGLQAALYRLTIPVAADEVAEADKFWTAHGEPFNRAGWDEIVDKYNGLMPLCIWALDEGTLVPSNVPMFAVENTGGPSTSWCTTWLETMLLRAVWYPTTVATSSYTIKTLIAEYLMRSEGSIATLPFKLHDFGSRGVSSLESAMLGGMAHLVNFMGTDTAVSILAAEQFYNAPRFATGFSIPAAEHSTITSWGRLNEANAYENMIRQFSKPDSIYAVVSDSYDIFNAVDNIWGDELRDLVISSGGTLVVRPDSGDPVEVLPRLISSLAARFGFTTNDKGYKVLNNVRLIWGDGINYQSISAILRVIVDMMGYSADNLAFGMGGALLQAVDRDTLKFAMKCSSVTVNGNEVDVFKDPITDPGKKSLAGRFSVTSDMQVVPQGSVVDDQLKLRFNNGAMANIQTFDQIRQRANANI